MVLRNFFAIDNTGLTVTSSPNGSIVGGPIINNSSTPDGTIFNFGGGTFREITVDDTGGGRNRLNDDLPDDHVVVDGSGLVADGAEIEGESIIVVRKLDDQGNPTGPEIDLYVFSQNGDFSDIWGFGSSDPLETGANYVKVDGDNDGTVRYNDIVACFTAGTLIDTPQGPVPVEEIAVGDLVWTQGSGPQPVRWVGSTRVPGRGRFAPVRIAAGALGNTKDLLVSQQHRIWIENATAELHFGTSAVLVAAKHLSGSPGVEIEPVDEVHYVHFMFDQHQIVRSSGLLTESFFLADRSIASLESEARAELDALFPDLSKGLAGFGATAAPTLTAREAAMMKHYLAA